MAEKRRGARHRSARGTARAAVRMAGSICLLSAVSCGKPPPPAPPPPAVAVARPLRRAVTDYLEVTGSAAAVRSVDLVARVAGYLEKVLFTDGQMVKMGQPLFVIQQDTYRDALRQAEAQVSLRQAELEYARSQLERYSGLLAKKAASQEAVDNWRFQRDSAQSNLKAAEAARDLAGLNLGYTEVAAPFDGRIDRRLVDPGNLVGSNGNTPLATINQIDPVYVYFTVSDLDLARLTAGIGAAPGQIPEKRWPIAVGLSDETGYPHDGRLDFASIALAPTAGTLLLRGVFPNGDGKIVPGLYARVRVPFAEKESLLVPQAAIGFDQQGPFVLVVGRKDRVEHRVVRTGPKAGDLQVVEDGLGGQEWVVVRGVQKAIPGHAVTPERAAPPAPAPPAPPTSTLPTSTAPASTSPSTSTAPASNTPAPPAPASPSPASPPPAAGGK